jgi:hypothetical protein
MPALRRVSATGALLLISIRDYCFAVTIKTRSIQPVKMSRLPSVRLFKWILLYRNYN